MRIRSTYSMSSTRPLSDRFFSRSTSNRPISSTESTNLTLTNNQGRSLGKFIAESFVGSRRTVSARAESFGGRELSRPTSKKLRTSILWHFSGV